jgi:hypothetical protein
MDEFSLGKEIGALLARVKALEEAVSKKGCGCGGAVRGQIEMIGSAKETDGPADPTITTRPDTGPDGMNMLADCTDGHLRRVTVNGVCYCQMCCGGQWVYFCYSNGQCIRCPGGVTVNCAGKNWILSC